MTDEVFETWTPLLPVDAAPVTDWREQDGTNTHCAGDPFCDAPEVDWKARALAAEAALAKAAASERQHGLLAGAWTIHERMFAFFHEYRRLAGDAHHGDAGKFLIGSAALDNALQDVANLAKSALSRDTEGT